MQGANTGKISHLMPTGHAGRNQHGVGIKVPSGWEEAAFSDGSGDVEVVTAIPKRAGHAAATRVQIGDGCPRNPPHERQSRRDEPE